MAPFCAVVTAPLLVFGFTGITWAMITSHFILGVCNQAGEHKGPVLQELRRAGHTALDCASRAHLGTELPLLQPQNLPRPPGRLPWPQPAGLCLPSGNCCPNCFPFSVPLSGNLVGLFLDHDTSINCMRLQTRIELVRQREQEEFCLYFRSWHIFPPQFLTATWKKFVQWWLAQKQKFLFFH